MANLTQALVGATNYTVISTDTKNTAGSTDTSSKIFLIGATSQAANPQTYSHDTAYVGTDGCLYSGGNKVLTSAPVTSVAGKTGAVTLTASDVGALASTTKYAGASTAGGSATSAAKLDTATAGSATQPCYFSNGVPSACTYSLNKTVPSDAVFTDTKVYYCTCEDGVTVSAKTASCSDTSFTLTAGVMVIVNFQHGYNLFNTLNINNTGAKNFKYQGKSSFNSASNVTGDISIPMVYDGTYWVIISSVDNYYMPNSVVASSNSDYNFLMSTSNGQTKYSPINTTEALSFNINEGRLTVKNNQANDPYMYYQNNDIVANGTTWDGTNTSLKTAITTAAGSVTQTATSTDAEYEILFSGTADNTTRTEGIRKDDGFLYNPSDNELILHRPTSSDPTLSLYTKIGGGYAQFINSYDSGDRVYQMSLSGADIELNNSTWDGVNDSLKGAFQHTPYMDTSGTYPLLKAPGNTTNWIRIGADNGTERYGIIPASSGNLGSGHGSIGTATWAWEFAHIDKINCKSVNGIRIHGGTWVKTITASGTHAFCTNANMNSWFGVTNCSNGNCVLYVMNGDDGAQAGKDIDSTYYNGGTWYVRFRATPTAGAYRFNYVVIYFG